MSDQGRGFTDTAAMTSSSVQISGKVLTKPLLRFRDKSGTGYFNVLVALPTQQHGHKSAVTISYRGPDVRRIAAIIQKGSHVVASGRLVGFVKERGSELQEKVQIEASMISLDPRHHEKDGSFK